jgi:hypothetical protein
MGEGGEPIAKLAYGGHRGVDAVVVGEDRIATQARRVALGIAGEDRLGGAAARDGGRQDALGGDRVGQAQGVADEEAVVAVGGVEGGAGRTGSTSGP